MAQFIRPTSDITVPASWNGTFADIDEVSASEADFGWSDNAAVDTYVTKFGTGIDPNVGTGHVVRVRHAEVDGGVQVADKNSTVVISLYQGAVLKATVYSGIVGAWTTTAYTLTGVEADSITDYSDLRLWVAYTGNDAGGTKSDRGIGISWAEMELPEVLPVDYNTTYSKGALLLGGKAASLIASRHQVSSKGSLALTGKTAILHKGKVLPSAKRSLTLGGKDSSLLKTSNVIANKGSIVLSGKNADLASGKKLISSKRSLLLGGKDSTLTRDWTLDSLKNSLSLTGKDALLTWIGNNTLVSSKGSYNLSGKVVTFTRLSHYNLTAGKGSFVLAGKVVTFVYGASNNLVASKGPLTLGGKVVTLVIDRTLDATKGAFVLNGKNAALSHGLIVDRTLVYNTRRVIFNNKIMTYNGN